MLLEIYQVLGEINYRRDKMMFISNVLPLWLEASLELPGSQDLGTTAFRSYFSQGVTVLCF